MGPRNRQTPCSSADYEEVPTLDFDKFDCQDFHNVTEPLCIDLNVSIVFLFLKHFF
jgi:hypothetical protein